VSAAAYDLPQSVGQQKSGSSWLVFVVFGIVASAIATQMAAAALRFNPELGRPFAHLPILGFAYPIWNWAVWSWQFSPFSGVQYSPAVTAAARAAIVHGLQVGAIGGVVVAIGSVFLSAVLGGKRDDVKDLQDSSGEWATEADVKRIGLFAPCGMIVGAFPTLGGWRTMRYAGDSGMTLTAPPGSGKTSAYLVPNLTCTLAHPDAAKWTDAERRAHPWGVEPSHLVLDVRGYLSKAASGWRRAIGHNVFIFEPFSTAKGRAKINPLWAIDVGGVRMYDHCYQAAVDAIGDTEGLMTSATTYWDQACTAFLAAVEGTLAFTALYRNDPRLLSYSAVIDYICSFQTIEELLINMEFTKHDPHGIFTAYAPREWDKGRCVWIMRCTSAMRAKEKEEKSGVFGTLAERLNIYRSPVIREHISESTFTFRQLANGDKPGCVYISIPGMKLDHARPLTRAIVSHALRELTEDGSENQQGREVRGNLRPVIPWLDEVAAMKTVPVLASSMGFLRGHGIYPALFWQSTAQLRRWYSADETLSETLKIHAFQAPNAHKAAKEWSEDLGSFSTAVQKRSTSHRNGSSDTSESVDIHSRPLLTPGEVLRLPRDETVLLAFGQKIRAKTPFYHMNRELVKRTKIPPVAQSDCIVSEPYFHERLARVHGREVLAKLLTSPPKPKPKPPAPYVPSMLEQHLLDERNRCTQKK
jgi:type IV secretion system protein VirD4